jgi:hypothetical protein
VYRCTVTCTVIPSVVQRYTVSCKVVKLVKDVNSEDTTVDSTAGAQ